MPTTLKPVYTSHSAVTMTSLNSLANNAYAGSGAFNNTSTGYTDMLVSVRITAGASGVSATGSYTVYAFADVDSVPTYTDSVTGTDAVQTPPSPTNLRPIGIGNCNANGGVFRAGPWSVAAVFGGRLPARWGLVVQNQSGAAFAASGHVVDAIGINDQGV